MSRGYRRDLIGHFVRTSQRTQQPCTHACCRGYRVHPSNYPVILSARTLHRASDDDLAAHFRAVSAGSTGEDRRAEVQLLSEMQRRDDEHRRRQVHRGAVESNRAARQMEREAEAERVKLAAEEYTKGYLVTAQGRARGVSDNEILTGRESVFIRYATPEAKAYFAEHARPTAAYLRSGRDTSVPYSDRPSAPRRTRALGWAPPRHTSRPSRKTRALGWRDDAA